jgi:hypothetical protein
MGQNGGPSPERAALINVFQFNVALSGLLFLRILSSGG